MNIKTGYVEYNIIDDKSLFDTGIDIKKDDIVIITADGYFYSGLWTKTGVYGPSGKLVPQHKLCNSIPQINDPPLNNMVKYPNDFGYPMMKVPMYCLLGRLNEKYFEIGDSTSFCYQGKSSRLYLDLNVKNNKFGLGSFQVQLKIWRRSYP